MNSKNSHDHLGSSDLTAESHATKMKPCPFCAGSAVLDTDEPLMPEVYCDNCEVRTGNQWGGVDEAVAAWNRRKIEYGGDLWTVLLCARMALISVADYDTNAKVHDAIARIDAALPPPPKRDT